MESVTTPDGIQALRENTILGDFTFESASVIFRGKGNVLLTPPGKTLRLEGAELCFGGDNSLVFLDHSAKPCKLRLSLWHDSFCSIGKNTYYNGLLHVLLSERTNAFVGDDCLFSFGNWLRTADPHLIYDAKEGRRINPSRSIFVGDHVWVGQDAMLLKGAQIGSGSILGAKSLLGGKRVPSNTVWGGNPAKQIRKHIFWGDECVHTWRKENSDANAQRKPGAFLYTADDTTRDFRAFEKEILVLPTAMQRGEALLAFAQKNEKNRFFIRK
ncbi:MAG: acyltransferase [Oscillospiraceae bacterium]|jgi:acetyltransferase-like isoleucine patch superfamily enzyme|nr:acyltransferase [Oscillospiraceae bacterium]